MSDTFKAREARQVLPRERFEDARKAALRRFADFAHCGAHPAELREEAASTYRAMMQIASISGQG